MDVYEASVRKVVSRGNLNASPLAEPSYSWSDVEAEESKAEKPNVQEQPKVEEPKIKEEPALTESVNEHLDKLITEIEDIVHSDSNIKVDVELESDEDMSDVNDMPELVDSESDMPELVSDTDSEMPDLVEESDNEDLMIAVFKRPSCPRCEAALKILLSHDENSESDVSEQEHTSDDSDESVVEEESSDESDDSDSDYVPSDMESEAERDAESDSESEVESPRMARKREVVIPPLIKFIIILLIVVRILKFLSNDSSNRIKCYA
jgi:hypothetical protein